VQTRLIAMDRSDQPTDVYPGNYVSVFGEAIERHKASVLRLQPAAPVR
jgi:hypothetical protein